MSFIAARRGLLGVRSSYALGTLDALVGRALPPYFTGRGGLGAVMAAVDALEWILLQSSVDDEFRGRAIGAWNLAIGFGWLGPILLGAAATQWGIAQSLAVSGLLLAVAGVVGAYSPGLRRA